ncbi:MAG: DUF2783 domain-containing protein [Roseiarcus sp.]
MQRNLSPDIADPDGFHRRMTHSRRNVSEAEAKPMNCKLFVIVANHFGEYEALREAPTAGRRRRQGRWSGRRGLGRNWKDVLSHLPRAAGRP